MSIYINKLDASGFFNHPVHGGLKVKPDRIESWHHMLVDGFANVHEGDYILAVLISIGL